jgi:two-component system, NarL family, response regulator YdfI
VNPVFRICRAENANAPLSAEWIEPLTPRELQILRVLSEGRANRAIAAQLEISEHTAKFHVGQILAKLNAQSRTEAVTIGIRRGLIMV